MPCPNADTSPPARRYGCSEGLLRVQIRCAACVGRCKLRHHAALHWLQEIPAVLPVSRLHANARRRRTMHAQFWACGCVCFADQFTLRPRFYRKGEDTRCTECGERTLGRGGVPGAGESPFACDEHPTCHRGCAPPGWVCPSCPEESACRTAPGSRIKRPPAHFEPAGQRPKRKYTRKGQGAVPGACALPLDLTDGAMKFIESIQLKSAQHLAGLRRVTVERDAASLALSKSQKRVGQLESRLGKGTKAKSATAGPKNFMKAFLTRPAGSTRPDTGNVATDSAGAADGPSKFDLAGGHGPGGLLQTERCACTPPRSCRRPPSARGRRGGRPSCLAKFGNAFPAVQSSSSRRRRLLQQLSLGSPPSRRS